MKAKRDDPIAVGVAMATICYLPRALEAASRILLYSKCGQEIGGCYLTVLR